jgi:hypothetical protein
MKNITWLLCMLCAATTIAQEEKFQFTDIFFLDFDSDKTELTAESMDTWYFVYDRLYESDSIHCVFRRKFSGRKEEENIIIERRVQFIQQRLLEHNIPVEIVSMDFLDKAEFADGGNHDLQISFRYMKHKNDVAYIKDTTVTDSRGWRFTCKMDEIAEMRKIAVHSGNVGELGAVKSEYNSQILLYETCVSVVAPTSSILHDAYLKVPFEYLEGGGYSLYKMSNVGEWYVPVDEDKAKFNKSSGTKMLKLPAENALWCLAKPIDVTNTFTISAPEGYMIRSVEIHSENPYLHLTLRPSANKLSLEIPDLMGYDNVTCNLHVADMTGTEFASGIQPLTSFKSGRLKSIIESNPNTLSAQFFPHSVQH